MINQEQLEFITLLQLRKFNLSIGWIDPDECKEYEEYESNDSLIHFETSEYFSIRFEKDTTLEDKSVELNRGVVMYVESYEPYDDWLIYSHAFKLPSLMCLENTESFKKALKDSIVVSHREMRLEQIRAKFSYVRDLSDDELLSIEQAKYVDIRFDMINSRDCIIGNDK